MPVSAPNLLEYFFLLIFNVETVLCVCDVRVRTIDLGCHLEWDCPDANPKTTYTVEAKTNGTWRNVSGCIKISRQSCDLTRLFQNIDVYNFVRLGSEELPGLNGTLICDPMNDSAATFSPPNISISMDNGSLWVKVIFPCAPSNFCTNKDLEMACPCPIELFESLKTTVTLYNKQNLSDTQTRTDEVIEGIPFKVEFGFLRPGQEYCAVANFTAENGLASSPMSLTQCVYMPAKIEGLVIMIVSAVLIVLGLMIFLLWRNCASSERPLPRSLALLQDLELQKDTFVDSCEAAPHESSEGDRVSVVSFCDFTFTFNQPSYYYNSQSMDKGYYTSPILHDPDCIEESVESGELGIEVQNDKFHLFPSHPARHAKVGCSYQNQCEETPNIPLSSVQVKRSQQDEMSTEDPEWYGDEMFKTEHETNEKEPEQIQTTDVSSQKAEYI